MHAFTFLQNHSMTSAISSIIWPICCVENTFDKKNQRSRFRLVLMSGEKRDDAMHIEITMQQMTHKWPHLTRSFCKCYRLKFTETEIRGGTSFVFLTHVFTKLLMSSLCFFFYIILSATKMCFAAVRLMPLMWFILLLVAAFTFS